MSGGITRISERPHSLWESRIEGGVENIYLHPSPAQQVILLSNVPHLTVSGGTGSGKTSLGPFWMMEQMELSLGEDALVVGYTEGALRRNVFPSLFPVLEHSAFRGNFSEKNMVYHTPFGDIFFCTNKNPQAIQGIHPAVIWCDELGSYSLETWKAIKGRMDRPDARLLGTTTPYGENWFLTDFVQRWRDGDPDYKVVYMSSLDNPTYPREKYYRDQREMTEDEFLMVHEGRIRRRHGLVYADFRKELIVERPVQAKCYAGMDFGLADPNAFLVVSSESASKYGKQAVTVHEEWYQSGVDDETIAENIFPLIRKYAIDTIFYDAHAGQTALDVRKHLEKSPYFMDSLRWVPMSETIDPGVNAVRTLTRRGELFVDPKCEYTLDEFETYSIVNGKPEAKDHNHCFDDKTEILTDKGWKLFADLDHTESVATMNPEWKLEWQKPTDYQTFNYKGDMVYIGGLVDLAITPDHNLLIATQFDAKKSHNDKLQLVPASTLADGIIKSYWVPRIVKPVERPDGDLPIPPYFLGFWLAEGSKSYRKQTNQWLVHVDNNDLNKLMRAGAGIRHQTPYRSNGKCHRMTIDSKKFYDLLIGTSETKRIPRWFFDSASPFQMQECYEGLIDGDGSWYNHKNDMTLYNTISAGLADDVQELAIRIGLSAVVGKIADERIESIRGKLPSLCKPVYRVYISNTTKSKYHQITTKMTNYGDYDSLVYCVTVPNHTVCVRRFGRSSWCGQCLDGLRYCVRGIQLYGDTELDSGDIAVHNEKLTHAQELFRIRPSGDDLYDVQYGED